MRVVTDLPRPVRVIDHVWIPLSDGIRLGARIWLPEDADDDPVPAILEYLPYRKGDGTAVRDQPRHAYFAGHGYAVLRVDIRGSGESGGLLPDEYLPQEQEDALEVLAWIAAQPWCTGDAGMFGISWGGFNGLQVAAHAPPAAEGRDQPLLDGRPLRRRRALPRRLGARARDALVGSVDAVVQRDPARPGRRRAGVARDVAGAHRRRRSIRARVASPPAPRRLLEAGLRVRGPHGDHVPGLRHRRVGGRILGGGVPAGGGPRRTLEGSARPVVACLPRGGGARAGDRLPPGVPALVGPVAEGSADRHRRRADPARVDAGAGHAVGATGGAARPLGGRGALALARDRGAPARARRRHARRGARLRRAAPRCPLGRRAPRGRHGSPLRARRGRLVRRRDPRRGRGRPARRRRPRALLHVRPARGAHRAARKRARRARAGERPAGRPARRPALRRGA